MSTSLAGPQDAGTLAGGDLVEAAQSHHDLRERAFRAHGGDWSEACRAWEAIRHHFPQDLDGYAFGIGALCEHGDRAGAQRVADEAVRLFPDHPRILTERALICFYTRDWPEARKRFALLRQRHPSEHVGYTRGVEVAENLGDHAEAFSVMDAARRRFPDDGELLLASIALAERLADPARAAASWGEQRRRSGDEQAYLGEGRSLAEAGRMPEAADVLREGLAHFPASTALAAEFARLASRQANWSDVVARWAPLLEVPELAGEAASRLRDAELLVAGAGAVALAVSQAGAGAVGCPVAELLGRRWTLRFGYGQVLGRNIVLGGGGELLNFYGAARSWELRDNAICLLDERRYRMAKLADVANGEDGRLRLTGRDCHHPTIQSVLVLEEQRPTIQAVMNDFESLGDNCEFGLVQRFFQAEPLGLLRFNWTAYDSLLAGLADGFSEISKPDCVRITRVGDGELIGHLDAYGFFYHTGRYGEDVDFGKFARSEAGRLRYLADKLLEDIEAGEKIYVRKGETGADIDRIFRLHEAIRKRGPATTLLWVTEADETHPAGTVEQVRDGLLRGHIDALAPYDAAARAVFDGWERICVRAHQIARPNFWAH